MITSGKIHGKCTDTDIICMYENAKQVNRLVERYKLFLVSVLFLALMTFMLRKLKKTIERGK